ncbi:LysR family transcriptional regulator [Nocardia sp. NPDC052001]
MTSTASFAGYSPPSVSHHPDRLEAATGVTLIQRMVVGSR